MIKNQIFWWYNNCEHFYFGFQYGSWVVVIFEVIE